MKAIKTAPDRKALEAGFLILALLPHRMLAVDTIREAAKRVAGMRMRVLRETSYERCADSEEKPDDWRGLWRAYTSLEAPGTLFGAEDLVVPEYPLIESQAVNRCDLTRLSESIWRGISQVDEEAKSRAPA